MFRSSELSDALNPNYYANNQATGVNESVPNPGEAHYTNYATRYVLNPQVVNSPLPGSQTEPASHVPHRSELQGVTNTSSDGQPLPERPTQPTRSRRTIDSVEFMRGLVAAMSSYKDAAEAEKKRRLAWEKEQEERYIRQETDLVRRLADLQLQIDDMKSRFESTPSNQGDIDEGGSVSRQSVQATPVEPPLEQPEFLQGSSTTMPNALTGKRTRSSVSLDPDRGSMKLRNPIDRRPKTVQAAMRSHILRMMDLASDKVLPPSHVEGDSDEEGSPVRFVWSQTTKRSAHNNRMKARVIANMIANKALYSLVPAQEFDQDVLDRTFEQAFTTLRQKANDNADAILAVKVRDKEDSKARRARRAGRKKAKLVRRVSTRKEFTEFSSSMLDVAFQIECMSSEESSDDGGNDMDAGSKPNAILRIRYLEWRSRRMQKLFQVLDEREEAERKDKPKRGVGRKIRQMGLPKSGNPPPPNGTSRWMVSKKWLHEAQLNRPSLGAMVEEILRTADGNGEVNWDVLVTLGEESDVEPSSVHPPMTVESEQQLYHHQHSSMPMMMHPPWTDGYATLYHHNPIQ